MMIGPGIYLEDSANKEVEKLMIPTYKRILIVDDEPFNIIGM